MGIYDSPAEDKPSYPKLPTYRAWCKENEENKTAEIYMINLIFLPSKIPNLTLMTEAFSIRIHEDNPMFEDVMHEITGNVIDNNVCIGIKVEDKTESVYSFCTLDSTQAIWKALGNLGWKVDKTNPKNKSNKKRSPKPEKAEVVGSEDKGDV